MSVAGLRSLLEANRSGLAEPASSPRGGYRVWGKMLPGVTTFLKKKLGLYRKRAERDPDSDVRASSRRAGKAFHRAAYHRCVCERSGACDCERAFGGREARKKPTPDARALAVAAERELERLGLAPVCGEQVVHSEDLPVATQFDLLCRRRSDGAHVLVSWKTGRTGAEDDLPLEPRLMLDSTAPDGEPMHVAQLTCEIAMLKQTHGLALGGACVVHVQTPKRDKRKRGEPRKALGLDRHGRPIRKKKGRRGEPALAAEARCSTRFLPREWVERDAVAVGWAYLARRWRERQEKKKKATGAKAR